MKTDRKSAKDHHLRAYNRETSGFFRIVLLKYFPEIKKHAAMKLFFTLLITLFFSVVMAQQVFDPEQNLRELGNLSPYSAGAVAFDNRYEGIQGTPFLFEDWRIGSIKFAKQDTFGTPVKLNVDLITQVVTVLLRNGSVGEMSATYIRELKVSDPATKASRQFIVAREGDIEGIRSVRLKFYEILHKGEFTFLKLVEKKFKKADFQGAYSADRRYDEFLTQESYWLQIPGKPFEKVNLKRKDIEKALAGYETQMAEITKKNKLNLNQEKDIVQLLSQLEKK